MKCLKAVIVCLGTIDQRARCIFGEFNVIKQLIFLIGDESAIGWVDGVELPEGVAAGGIDSNERLRTLHVHFCHSVKSLTVSMKMI